MRLCDGALRQCPHSVALHDAFPPASAVPHEDLPEISSEATAAVAPRKAQPPPHWSSFIARIPCRNFS